MSIARDYGSIDNWAEQARRCSALTKITNILKAHIEH